MVDSMQDQLTLFAGDIPANPSQPQVSSKAKPTRATSGRKCTESFETHAPAGSLPRMFADMLASVSTPLPHNWKMTASPSGRLLFQLAPSARPTDGTASGFWPTIRATDGERGGRGDLIQAVRGNPNEHYRLWQTPVADDAVERANGKWNSRGEPKLSAEVKLWPTPTVNGNNNRAGMSEKSGDGLATAVKSWPTPCATMYKGGSNLIRKSGKSRVNDRLDYAVEQGKPAANGQLNPDVGRGGSWGSRSGGQT